MLTHIVCFKFNDPAYAVECQKRLLAMKGNIPSLLDIEVGLDVTHSGRSYDLGLITRHSDAAGLAAYSVHPVHEAVALYIREGLSQAVAVDFTSGD